MYTYTAEVPKTTSATYYAWKINTPFWVQNQSYQRDLCIVSQEQENVVDIESLFSQAQL